MGVPGYTLAPGACAGFRPGTLDRHETVFIDPGHGGLDPGTGGTTSNGDTIVEKDLALQVSMKLRDDLLNLGYTVVMSRTTDSQVTAIGPSDVEDGFLTEDAGHRDAAARVACANASRAKALLSVHFNGFDDPTIGGAETYFDADRDFSSENTRLAALVQQALMNAFQAGGWPVPDRGILPDDGAGTAYSAEATSYGHLFVLGPAQSGWNDAPSTMPGALAEPLFITRPTEGDVAASSQGQAAIASGLAAGLQQFLHGAPAPQSP